VGRKAGAGRTRLGSTRREGFRGQSLSPKVPTDQSDHRSVLRRAFAGSFAGDMNIQMNGDRVALSRFSDGSRDWLKSVGPFSEFIDRKTRFFVPTTGEWDRVTEPHCPVELANLH